MTYLERSDITEDEADSRAPEAEVEALERAFEADEPPELAALVADGAPEPEAPAPAPVAPAVVPVPAPAEVPPLEFPAP
jgi:hypothetical protein